MQSENLKFISKTMFKLMKECYESEIDMFVARSVLDLLQRGADVEKAE